ncbi:hypothetical protein D3C71_1755380 [compost metagenome]
MQQERRIADQLHIPSHEGGEEQVFGQACNTEDHAENGREYTTEQRHFQRVEQASEHGAKVGIAGRESDRAFADFEVRGTPEEIKAG